ncbi:MAG: DUF1624 domain-containing protein [Haliscomenobacteraceae bacterium CHB4]|nr:hypothetical protein [Saprospiraceae bacterium]MCE7922594.1 DUF1624 domain-containing protein [Haliscomenobacteraceae bacterium CHB4]
MSKENNPSVASIVQAASTPFKATPNENTSRVISLDLLRGIVMVIMALDHVRDFTHYGTFFNDPTNLATTNPALFFTRWITHFCAPIFVFLAGTSAFLYGVRRGSTRALSRFLLTRGLWLIFMELTVINLGISFDISFSLHIFQVIWAIGLSMICLGGLVYLPKNALIAIGLLIVACHNLLDGIAMQGTSLPAVVWYFLHQANFLLTGPNSAVFIVYPVLPWIGLMALGYAFGHWYRPGSDSARRKAFLWKAGLVAIGLFVFLRTFNIYGDPRHWAPQKDFVFSVLSFLNTTKYPPSLLYLLMTLGPAMLFLYWAEDRFKRQEGFFATIGRVPFFYYILHFYVVHIVSVLGVLYAGLPWRYNQLSAQNMAQPEPELLQYGYPLIVTYSIWLLVIAIMYPLCKWYDRYKRNNRDKWWLSYL